MDKLKCCECETSIRKQDAEVFAKRFYCVKCYKVAKEEEKERRHLIAVICDIFNIQRPSGMMFTQMKQFKEEGISYRDTRLTLQYLVSVESFKLEKKYGIGIVRHRHEDMKEYYERMLKKRREVQSVEYKPTNHTITIGKRENKLVKKNMIDLDKLVRGDIDE